MPKNRNRNNRNKKKKNFSSFGTPQEIAGLSDPTSGNPDNSSSDSDQDSDIETPDNTMDPTPEEIPATPMNNPPIETEKGKESVTTAKNTETAEQRKARLIKEKREKDERRKLDPDLYNLDFTAAIKELDGWDLGIVNQDVDDMARAVTRYVDAGSQLHTLFRDDIQVYAELEIDYPEKSLDPTIQIGECKVSTTIEGMMKSGARFFDALIFRSMKPDARPDPLVHPRGADGTEIAAFAVYNDKSKLATYLFVTYFYTMIRAHPPLSTGDYVEQNLPRFISNVMSVDASITEIADYVASFPLSKLNPNWVTRVPLKHISQQAVSRFGLGVAGYRYVSIFNVVPPDKYTDDNIDKKPKWLDTSIEVMKSFRKAGYCWDFHPSTRNPELLTKYGNINKNAMNLIFEAYTPEKIEELVKMKKLPTGQSYDPAHVEYKTYTIDMTYVATNRIFGKK